MKDESVSFTVDRIGVPVLVKVSYFPNWTVSGASDVYRAAPNMMVVVPTSKNVTLSYEPSGLDNSAYLLTLIGMVMVYFMFRRRFHYGSSMPERSGPEEENTPLAQDASDSVE